MAQMVGVVSTHSRPKAAGCQIRLIAIQKLVSTHSRPKAAGWTTSITRRNSLSFNTQPPEGGWLNHVAIAAAVTGFQHTAARRRLVDKPKERHFKSLFQHTAARRRLAACRRGSILDAGFNTQPPEGGWKPQIHHIPQYHSFNTQPPEGGWSSAQRRQTRDSRFNTQPPEGGWRPSAPCRFDIVCFNTQPPEGGWQSRQSHQARD